MRANFHPGIWREKYAHLEAQWQNVCVCVCVCVCVVPVCVWACLFVFPVELPLPAEWAAAVIIDLPSAKTEIHTSVLPAVLRVMCKGARLSITHRDKDADSKAWVDRLVCAQCMLL
jgi:hypothetical protein